MQKSHIKFNTVVAGLIGYLLSLKPIFDPDVDWHLAAGRWMVENKSWIHTDPFSWTFFGKPWVSIPWLHEVITWLLYSVGGDTLVVMGLSLIPASILALLYRSCASENDNKLTQGTLMAAVTSIGLVSCYRWSCRPEIWSHLIGVMFVIIITKALADEKKQRLLYFLIPLQILWTNTHGVFIMGPIIASLGIFAFIYEKRNSFEQIQIKHWFLSLTLITASTLINPLGLKGALFPFHLLKVLRSPVYSKMIGEAVSPFIEGTWGIFAYLFLAVFALYAISLSVYFFRKKSVDAISFFATGIFILTAYTSFTAIRNLPLMALWCFPVMVKLLSPTFSKIKATVVFISLAMIILNSFQSIAGIFEGANRFRNWEVKAEETAQFIEKNKISGKGFVTDKVSNYFLHRLYGQFRPFIDSRFAEVYDEAHFLKYMKITTTPELIEQPFDGKLFDFVVINHETRNQTDLARYLLSQPDRWQLVHLDSVTLTFVRRGTPQYAKWADHEEAELKEDLNFWANIDSNNLYHFSSAKLNGLARAFGILNKAELAKNFFSESVKRNHKDTEAQIGLCNSSVISCKPTDTDCFINALSLCENATKYAPLSEPALIATGVILKTLGRLDEAKIKFQKCVKLNPRGFEANFMLGETILLLNDRNTAIMEAEPYLLAATSLRPSQFMPVFLLAQLYDTVGNLTKAANYLLEAQEMNPPEPIRSIIQNRLIELEKVGMTLKR